MGKLLTIAIPTYNRAPLLQRLLNIIKNCYQEEIQIIVSDNLSTDNTPEIVKQFPFVDYFCNERNVGADRNFLACYQRAKGEYVWLVGSDDVISENAIKVILNFIEKHNSENIPVIFLNHTSFKGDFIQANINNRSFLANGEDIVIDDLETFMHIVKNQLTFMSSFILNKKAFEKIDEPRKYEGTYFIHTCLAFETMIKPNCQYGLIRKICVFQDLTPGNSNLTQDYAKLYCVFGKWMYWTLVELTKKLGFPEKQMKKIYIRAMLGHLISWTIYSKAGKKEKDIEGFWKYCFPVIKHYAIGWLTVIPIAILPAFVSRLYIFLKKYLR